MEPMLPKRKLSCIEVWAHWHELVVPACVDARIHSTLNRLRAHVRNQGNSDVAILGPPGTGKTTTLVACVSSIVEFRRHYDDSTLRCLVMAESNTAVSVLEKRLAKQVPNVVRVMTESRLKSAQSVDPASLPSGHSCQYVCNKNTTGLQTHMDSTEPLVMVASMGSLSSLYGCRICLLKNNAATSLQLAPVIFQSRHDRGTLLSSSASLRLSLD